MNKKDTNYTVSVRLMTYMHAPFIKEAMDGIMMQETDFKVEVVVGDDFSTDGTLDIIKTYSDTENIHIKILKREKGDEYWQKRQELGRLYNFINILENCSGKYIALLDGDDYWTDPLKLQKQVDFLEGNKEYNLVTSYVTRYIQNKKTFFEPKKIKADSFDYKDMIEKNHSPTCATLVLNLFDKDFSFFEGWGTDSQIWLRILGNNKKGFKMAESMAVYRKHDGGVSKIAHKSNKAYSDKKKYAMRKIEKAEFWNAYFDNSAEEAVKNVKLKIYKYIVSLAKREKKYSDLLLHVFKYYSIKFGL